MFDRTKERIARLEETNETFRKISHHLRDNKKTYAFCGATGVVCFVGGKHFQRPIEVTVDFKPVINNMPTFNNHNIGNSVQNNVGRVSKIVRDTQTGQEWQKMRYLAEKIAEERGISYDHARTLVSQNVRGLRDHVFGQTYEIAGLRTDV